MPYLWLLVWASLAVSQAQSFVPARILGGSTASLLPTTALPVVLNTVGQTFYLDYGYEVAGIPYFIVSNLSNPVQVESKYSEELSGIDQPYADGPYPFSVGLSSTFRTETFNVSTASTVKSYFVQGGQRWQSFTLLTPGSITVTGFGFEPSYQYKPVQELPGHFECSNSAYNEIWGLGALASSAACLEAGSQPATWNITSEGALIHGQKPATSAVGENFVDYTLSFRTRIVRGGSGWSIAQSISSGGLQLLLVSNLPNDTTFVNTNTSLTPANSIVLAYGYSFVNQTTLPSRYLDTFKLPNNVTENTWYEIDTSVYNGTILAVTVNGTVAFNISLSDYGVVLTNPFNPFAKPGQGSWGFGPWQDQTAVYTDVVVTSNNGTTLYENQLTSESVLSEYGVARNNITVCLDGPKRDRLVWLGDFFHTTRIIAASTARRDHVLGTLQYMIDWQNEEGLLPIDPPMGVDPSYASQIGSYDFLQDYQTLGLLAFTGYYDLTGDIEFARQLWPGFQKQIQWLLSTINSTVGLSDISGFTGPAFGTATSAQLVQALNEAATLATDIGDTESAQNYTSAASSLSDTIYNKLWNDTLGVYVTSLAAPSNFSVADIAFAITSGVAGRNASRTQRMLSTLEQLKLGPGYKDTSSTSSSDPATNISPNINGFLLSALMQVNATEQAVFLFNNLWTAMISNNATKTGASWEYVNAQTLNPGLSLFTSLSHPWGGAPTYILPQWVAGIKAVKPGYRLWTVVPGLDLVEESASATVPTQYGTLSVTWRVDSSKLTVGVLAPSGTSGSFSLPAGHQLGNWTYNGQSGQGGQAIALSAGVSNITVTLAS